MSDQLPDCPAVHTLDDPEPQAPVEPPLEACCTSGCVPCIFDLYTADLHKYRREHEAWLRRQKMRENGATEQEISEYISDESNDISL